MPLREAARNALLARHEVKIIHKQPWHYRLVFRRSPRHSTLDALVGQHQFEPRDLEMRRVGLIPLNRYGFALWCFPCLWAEYVLLSKTESREQLPERERFKVLGMSCIVKTSDERIVMTKRSKSASHYAGYYHVGAGGYIDANRAAHSRSALPQAYAELCEELGVLPTQVASLTQLGLCEQLSQDTAELGICYLVQLTLDSEKLLSLYDDALDKQEGTVATYSRGEVAQLLHEERCVPDAAAALVMANLV